MSHTLPTYKHINVESNTSNTATPITNPHEYMVESQPILNTQSKWTLQRIIMLCGVIMIYMCSGIGLTLLNKYFLSVQYYNFHYPITLIMIHMGTNSILSYCYIQLFLRHKYMNHSQYYRNITLYTYCTKYAPLGLLFGGDIVLTTISISQISVALVEIIKAVVPAVIIVVQIIRQQIQVTVIKVLTIFLLVSGAILTTNYSQLYYVWFGVLCAAAALVACSMKLICIELLLNHTNTINTIPSSIIQLHNNNRSIDHEIYIQPNHHQTSRNIPHKRSNSSPASSPTQSNDGSRNNYDASNELSAIKTRLSPNKSNTNLLYIDSMESENNSNNKYVMNHDSTSNNSTYPSDINSIESVNEPRIHPIMSLFYFSPISFVMIFIMFICTEYHGLNYNDITQHTILLILLGASMSFVLNVIELYVIQYTSALSLCVLAISKLVMVIGISSIIFPESIQFTSLNIAGIIISILGVMLYNYNKYNEHIVHEKYVQLQHDNYIRQQLLQNDDGVDDTSNNTPPTQSYQLNHTSQV